MTHYKVSRVIYLISDVTRNHERNNETAKEAINFST